MDIDMRDVFTPKAVLVVYEGDTASYESQGKIYIEAASVKEGVTGSFTPLSDRMVNSFGKTMLESSVQKMSGIVPDNLFYVSFDNLLPDMIWFTKPKIQMLYYDPALNILSGEFPLPWLVWRIFNGSLYIYASKRVPTLDTMLYKGPFHNTGTKGQVCMGTGYRVLSKEFVSFTNTMAVVEKAFYDTKFNAVQDTHRVKGNLNTLHQRLVEGKRFDYNILISTKQTIRKMVTPKTDKHAKQKGQQGTRTQGNSPEDIEGDEDDE